MPTDLIHKKCVPCEGGTDPLTLQREDELHTAVPDWQLIRNDIHHIEKTYQFKNFVEALAFANKVGELAQVEGHHPNLHLFDYNKLKIEFTTHAIGGLSENDFIMAAKINEFPLT